MTTTPLQYGPTPLIDPVLLDVVPTAIYTAPASGSPPSSGADAGVAKIELKITNELSIGGYVSIQILRVGDTRDDETYIAHHQIVHARQTRTWLIPVIGPGDKIYVWADGHGRCLANEAMDASETGLDWDNPSPTPINFPAVGILVERQEGSNTREEMAYSSFTGTTSGTFTVVRGAGGTVASSHADNADVLNYYLVAALFGTPMQY